VVWDTISTGAYKAAKFNHWPKPFNFVKSIEVLVCNADDWYARIELAAAVAGQFFWTELLPSPRELERKFTLGGYRCGFYLGGNFRSPVEWFGPPETTEVLAHVAGPFTEALFYIWMQGALFDALQSFETVLWPQEHCIPFKGDFLSLNSGTFIVSGDNMGGVQHGQNKVDPFGMCAPSGLSLLTPGGSMKAYAFWVFDAGTADLTNCAVRWTGAGLDSSWKELGDCPAGHQLRGSHYVTGVTHAQTNVTPEFRCHSGLRVIPGGVAITVCIFDDGRTWGP